MNAIIGLCHFCESHGPRVVLYTYCVRGAETEVVLPCENPPQSPCPACSSIGPSPSCYVSKESDSPSYYTRQTPTSPGMKMLLKQACIRSLSCEVSTSKDNALIFFGNSIQQEYVLSNTFQLKDTRARGLKRLFSIIVIMKDKMYLLNLTPHFSKQIQAVVTELECLCDDVFAKEQASCSQRALRLKREKMDSDPPRSLVQLTGRVNVFAYLHIKFCHMLSSAAKIFKEVSVDQDFHPEMFDVSIGTNESHYSIRQLNEFLIDDIFLKVLYCTLVGIQIVIRGNSEKCSSILALLESLLPKRPVNLEFTEYVPPTEARLFSCKTNVAVPQPCSGVCRVDIVNDKPVLHWSGELPEKLPTLMNSILKIMNETELSDLTIAQQILALREEWQNHAMALKIIPYSSHTLLASMKRSLGIKSQDETLIEYWMANFIQQSPHM